MTEDKHDFSPEEAAAVWDRIAQDISAETGEAASANNLILQWREPPWREAAPGLSYKFLAADEERHRVSLMVRLAPGAAYPPHQHAGIEVLHLLEGELWIDDQKLFPGDYHRSEPGSSDQQVWTATGCTCVLITSTRDVLR